MPRATGNSVAFQYTAPGVVLRDFDGIRMDITYKDLELQTALAKSRNVPLFLATICQQIYQMGRAAGLVDRLQHLVPTLYIVVPAEAGTQERQTLELAALGPRLRGGDGGGGRNHLSGSHH